MSTVQIWLITDTETEREGESGVMWLLYIITTQSPRV